jgi:hypothetical protein
MGDTMGDGRGDAGDMMGRWGEHVMGDTMMGEAMIAMGDGAMREAMRAIRTMMGDDPGLQPSRNTQTMGSLMG